MRNKLIFLLILLLLIVSMVGCNIHKANEENDRTLAEFETVVNNVMDNFICNGYEEIMKDKSTVLALPLEYEKVDEAVDYLALQKLFVYKNTEKDVIILLQITKSQAEEDSWNHSVSYRPAKDNDPESETVVDIPEVEVGAYSFTYEGYNYMSIGLSESESADSYLATTELVSFNNELINFIIKETAESEVNTE